MDEIKDRYKKRYYDSDEDTFIAPRKTKISYRDTASDADGQADSVPSAPIELTKEQKKAFDQIQEWYAYPGSNLFTLGGYAGTGKTTLIAELAKHWIANKDEIGFCTFTWKAAHALRRKLRAAGIDVTPTSLHRLLYTPETDSHGNIVRWVKNSSIEYSTVVVDEVSMLTPKMMDDLLSCGVRVLAVGDHAQLPPIEGESVLRILDALLTQVCRQAQDSPIIKLATHVRYEGDLPADLPAGILTMSEDEEVQAARARDAEEFGELDVAILTYTNRYRVAVNSYIRQYQNKPATPSPGDVIMCLSNQPPLFNGMRGLITNEDFNIQRNHWYVGAVDFPDDEITATGSFVAGQFHRERTFGQTEELGREVKQDLRSVKDAGILADFGYAMTVHKAQGSEFKSVYLLHEKPYKVDPDGFRRWLYTAITRASKKLTVVY